MAVLDKAQVPVLLKTLFRLIRASGGQPVPSLIWLGENHVPIQDFAKRQPALNIDGVINENISTDNYYTSDYDLSKFNANQYGFGVSYTDIFTKANVWKFGIKNVDLRFHQYDRSNGLSAWIVSGAIKFVMQ